MGKRDYLPIIAILLIWLSTASTGLSTPGIGDIQIMILSIIGIPLLVAIIIAFVRVHRQNKQE